MKTMLRSFVYFSIVSVGFEKAVQDKRWKEAVDEEIKAIEKNST